MASLLWIVLGLALFLAGLHVLSSGLRRAAGPRLRRIISSAAAGPGRGFLAGVAATGIVQSSSAVNVTVVGFVGAGLLDLTQAVSVMVGSNVGTTVTSQLLAFDVQAWAPAFVAAGALTYCIGVASRRTWNRRWRFGAGALVGFGAILLGMDVMGRALAPVAGSSLAAELLAGFGQNSYTAIVAGALFTGVVQSSSMTSGMAMVLADAGLVPLSGAVGLVLGANVGTVVTTLLAGLGSGVVARRAAVADLLFNVAGVGLFALFLPVFLNFVAVTATDPGRQVANAHFLFNIVTALAVLPFVSVLASAASRLVPGGPGQD